MKIRNALALGTAVAVTAIAPASAGAQERDEATRTGIAPAQPAEIAAIQLPAKLLKSSVRAEVRDLRAERRKARERRERRKLVAKFTPLPGGVSIETLEAIAACESGGDPTIVSSDGSYRGKYQFSFETWASVGGSGDPAAAPEIEQDYRAATLYAMSGSSPWPVCGV